MMIANIIALGVIIICLILIIAIAVRKFPQLTQIDVETLPETKEGETKDRLVRAKLERNLLSRFRSLSKKSRPVAQKAATTFKTIFDKTLEMERKYRSKLGPRTAKEQQKVDAKTEDLVKSGEEFLAQDKFAEAERKFIDAITLDPHDVEAYQGLGELYWEQGKLEEARETFDYVIKLNADSYDAHSYLGNIALKSGNLEKARDHHLKSVELDSQAAVRYLDLAEVYKEMGEEKQAFECLEKAVGLEPNNPRNLDAVLDMSIMMGKKKQAQEYLEKLAEVNPENKKLSEFQARVEEM